MRTAAELWLGGKQLDCSDVARYSVCWPEGEVMMSNSESAQPQLQVY